MKNRNKSFLKVIGQRKKIYGISYSFILFFSFALSLLIFFSYGEYKSQRNVPISDEDFSRNIDSYNFYEDGLFKQRIEKFKVLYDNWQGYENNVWEETKKPSETEIAIVVSELYDLDEKTSSIYAKGFIYANWNQDSISYSLNDSNDSGLSGNYEQSEESRKDILSSSYLNFFDSENQIYKNIYLDNTSGKENYSTYEFAGRFKLERDLRRFPFDEAKLKITLSTLNSAVEVRYKASVNGSVDEDRYRFEAFIHVPKQCYGDDYYEVMGIKENKYSYACNYNFLRPMFTFREDEIESGYISREFYDAFNKIDFSPVSVLETYLIRSSTSSFFRYILPLIAGVSVLMLTENLSNKFQEIKVATPPTVLLTFIFMQNGYLSEIPQLSYITYMDKLYLLSYLLAILQLANALVTVDSRNKVDRFSKKYFKFTFDKIYRFSFIFVAVFAPLLLFFYT